MTSRKDRAPGAQPAVALTWLIIFGILFVVAGGMWMYFHKSEASAAAAQPAAVSTAHFDGVLRHAA